MIAACEDTNLRLLSFAELTARLSTPEARHSSLYIGLDPARYEDLCVIDVGEKIGDVTWDRLRIELHNKTYSEIEFELYRLLRLPQVKRCCIDKNGMGDQLTERAKRRFGWKVEGNPFTPQAKEELAFGLRADFEDLRLRLVRDDKLRSDLRGIKKDTTRCGNIRFGGECADSHCDRFWALALRQHAGRQRMEVGAAVG